MLSESRLVTLIGVGGVGKTRLAVRTASQVGRAYPDGVCFVALGDLSDPALIAEATASALGLHERTGPVGIPLLVEHLSQRDLLLLLDNCEHLVDGCAALASALLEGCPRLHILTTSRETLRVPGEAVWRVGPLSAPGPEVALTTVVNEYEAVHLLAERAARVAPGFTLSEHNLGTIGDICRLLEGIPLALELAAVRLRALSPTELLEQLQNRWESLDVNTRGAPPRHRAMTACLEWSHALCSAEERDLWALLSVFAGGMEMPAIRYIALRMDHRLGERAVELVQSLVDKSILVMETRDDRARYRMLEVIRQFGVGQLANSGSLDTAQVWHRDCYAELLRGCDDHWMSDEQTSWIRQLRREDQNLRQALTTCWRQPGEGAVGLEMAARLRKLTVISGNFTEGRTWLRRFLSLVPEPGMVRLRGLRAASWLAAMQGDPVEAAVTIQEAIELADELGPPATWLVDQAAGLHHMFVGDFQVSAEHLKGALAGLRTEQLVREQAETLVHLGMSQAFAGDLTRAAETIDRALELCSRTGETWYRSYGLWFSGLLAWQQGDQSRGTALEMDALRLSQSIDDRLGSALSLEAAACCDSKEAPRRAAVLLGAADALWDAMGTSVEALPGLSALRHASQGAIEASMGDGFSGAYNEGRALTPALAIAFALGPSTPSRSDKGRPANDDDPRFRVLTRREREIAGLVAEGLTNREIATKLVISPRTAETHVENILTKLGFNSRSQIVAWISRTT